MAALSKRIEDISAALSRLSRREKFMVGGLTITFVAFVGILVSMWISSSLGGLRERIATKTVKLEEIIGMREKYEQAKLAQRRAEERIKRDRQLQLMGTLENLAKQLGISTNDLEMSPRNSSVDAETGIEEKKVDVKIPRITIDRLVDFLEQLERKSESIKVRTLHIKKNFKDKSQLDAEFAVSKFEKREEKEEAPADKKPATK